MDALVPIVVFGLDYNQERTQAGPGTQLRCLKGVDVYHELQMQGEVAFFIVSPGQAPGVTYERQPHTMARMMAQVLIALEVPSSHIHVGEPTWGTRGELLEAVRVIRKRKQEAGVTISKAYLVSNRIHLRRISVLAAALKRNLGLGWEWHRSAVLRQSSSYTMRELLEEFAKTAVELQRARRWHPEL